VNGNVQIRYTATIVSATVCTDDGDCPDPPDDPGLPPTPTCSTCPRCWYREEATPSCPGDGDEVAIAGYDIHVIAVECSRPGTHSTAWVSAGTVVTDGITLNVYRRWVQTTTICASGADCDTPADRHIDSSLVASSDPAADGLPIQSCGVLSNLCWFRVTSSYTFLDNPLEEWTTPGYDSSKHCGGAPGPTAWTFDFVTGCPDAEAQQWYKWVQIGAGTCTVDGDCTDSPDLSGVTPPPDGAPPTAC
jgi:hypothetical protein